MLTEDPDGAFEYVEDLGFGDEDEAVSSRSTDTDKAWAGLRALSYLEGYYVNLVRFFDPAATDQEPILIWMD